MDKLELRKAAEAASLSRMGTAILKGNKMEVKFLPEGASELGFTSGMAKVVNVAWFHSYYFKDLTDIEGSILRMGIFAHELLHQCFTNFSYTNTVCEMMTRAEAAVFMQFANTLEDPAIEYFAPNVMGGRLLDALRFSIRRIYSLSSPINEIPSAFSQLIGALIHFGDMGIVKGNFTFPEAEEYFKKVAPLYNEGITCPDSKRRIDIAKECMEITKPLWEEDVKDAELLEKLINEMMEMLKKSGLHLFEDEEAEMKDPSEESDPSKRRSMVVKGLKKEEEKTDDDAESAQNGEGEGSEEENEDSEENSNSGSSEDSESSNSKPSQSDKDNSDKSSSSDNSDVSNESDINDYENSLNMSEERANQIANETFEIDDELAKQIEESICREEAKISKSEKNESGKEGDLPDFDIRSSVFKNGASCLNRRVVNSSRCNLGSLYNKMVKDATWEIKVLTKTLDRIFKSDIEETNRATSGSYNIKRGSIGTSARIFDKRRDPGNLKDAQVVLCVDLSGSMCGSKVAQARKTAIVLAESLTKLNIPYYIMGFTADNRGYEAVHNHFVDWNNKRKDRESLAAMEAGGNNFDGYSIRYAAELLRARNSNHKILFVISDGEPACYKYSSMRDGLSDTTNAIKEARKFCTVFGIAIGKGCSPSVLQKMYGKDFIHCEDEKLLTNMLCKKLEKVLLSKK